MANRRVQHDPADYGALVARKLRELRDEHDWNIDDFRRKLAEYGVKRENGEEIPVATAYSYEQGKGNGGADLPINLVPTIAQMYGYKTPNGWLPAEFPESKSEPCKSK